MATSNFSVVLPLSVTFFLLLLSNANSTNTFSFTFNNFVPDQQDLILQGDAVITSSGKLQLTAVDAAGTPTFRSLGRALYGAPIHLWDSATGKVASFATSFSFNISAPVKSNTADGLAFFIAPPGSQPQGNGGYLGLFNSVTYNKSIQTVAVEFDTYINENYDPSNKHIGIDVNTIRSIKTASWGLANGQLAKVLVTFDASTKLLVASLVHPSRRTSYILSEIVDLKTVLPEWVSVGFSATTGLSEPYVETHDVHSWAFASKLSDDSSDPLDLASFVLHEAI